MTSDTQTARVRPEPIKAVPVRHPWFLRPALRRVLSDRALRDRLGARAATDAEQWSWDTLAVRLLEQVVRS